MERIKILVQSIKYSIKLIYSSSKLMIILSLSLNIISRTFPFVNMFIMKILFDELVAERTEIYSIAMCLLIYIAILISGHALSGANAIITNTISEKMGHRYDVELSDKLAKLPMSFIDTSAGRDLIDEVRYAKFSVIGLSNEIINIVSTIYSFAIAFVALVAFNTWFSLLIVFLTIPGIVYDVIFDHKNEELRRKTAPDVRKFSYYRWMLTDSWPAKDVRMYDLTEPIQKRYDDEKNIYRKANKKLDQKKLKTSLFIEIIKQSGIMTFTAFVVFQAISGKITIGDIALYIGFATTVNGAFQDVMTTFALWHTTFADRMKRFFEFTKIECPDENKGAKNLDEFESLVFDNVYFKYPLSDKYVLNGTSFELKSGDKISIVGVNGAGKSTIVKLMLGLYQIESGQILVNGNPISDYTMKDIRKMFAILFQNFVQYPLSLRDNVALSNFCADCCQNQQNNGKIIEALKKSGIYDELGTKLESYMTRQFADDGIELSKGQWQKIALSRVYFKNAPIVIFDEPSAALDAEAEDKIFENFKNIAENRTGIMISHRISSSKISNKIIVLDEGKIIENGNHDELIALDGLYAKLYNLQMEKYTLKEEQSV